MKNEKQDIDKTIKLTQNENAFGASPLALKAIESNYQSVFRYPEILHKELSRKIAGKYQISPDAVIVAAGSIALMDMTIKTFVDFEENIVTAKVTFEGYKYMAKINRRACRLAELVDNTISLDNIRSECDSSSKVIFIANPNNPTGTIITHADLRGLLEELPTGIIVVIDEAYAEYIDDDDYPDSLELQREFPNLVIFRTFSKIYGLAGLRIAYAIADPPIIQSLLKHRTPFSINGLAATAALAALDDDEYIKKCAAVNLEERAILYDELIEMGFNATRPHGNFIFVEFRTVDDLDEVYNHLFDNGILVRKLGPFGCDLGLRISVGRPDENQYIVTTLKALKQI